MLKLAFQVRSHRFCLPSAAIFRTLVAVAFLSGFLIGTTTAGEPQLKLVKKFDAAESPSGPFLGATAVDLDGEGSVYIVERGRHRLLKFSASGAFIREVGGFGQGAEQFDEPRDVCARNTINVFVADFNNDRVVRFDKNLNFLNEFSSNFDPPFNFEQVLSVAVSSQNDLFILENVNHRVLKFNRFSEPSIAFGGYDDPYGQLLEPDQITLDGSRHLFVSDPAQSAVVVFDYLGNFSKLLKHPEMNQPTGLFWGEDRNLYVVDAADDQLFIFSAILRFSHKIDLTGFSNHVQDVAVSYDKLTRRRRLYLLTSFQCLIFELSMGRKEK